MKQTNKPREDEVVAEVEGGEKKIRTTTTTVNVWNDSNN